MTNREETSFEIFEQISEITGEEKAFEICQMFAGEQIVFPKSIIRLKRNHDMRKEFKKGADYRELSIKYDLTSRQVRSICCPGSEEDQLDLFDALS